ncbi:MAG: shikimate dehydrogenase [Candidatus Omnitrophota bacterium]
MLKYGLIGYPLGHSLSAVMHNAALRHLGIEAQYCLFEIAPRRLKGFMLRLRDKGDIRGLNITIPYKQRVMKYLDRLDNSARDIGAVNTIKREPDGRLAGFNTDGCAFMRRLRELGFSPRGKRIAILGAGGAARAVALGLAREAPQVIRIYNRHLRRAKQLAGFVRRQFEVNIEAADDIAGLDIPGVDLLVNATPLGMQPKDACLVDEGSFSRGILVYDLIYNPPRSELLLRAQRQGARTENGLKMLLYQGAQAFNLWTNLPAPERIMEAAISPSPVCRAAKSIYAQ